MGMGGGILCDGEGNEGQSWRLNDKRGLKHGASCSLHHAQRALTIHAAERTVQVYASRVATHRCRGRDGRPGRQRVQWGGTRAARAEGSTALPHQTLPVDPKWACIAPLAVDSLCMRSLAASATLELGFEGAWDGLVVGVGGDWGWCVCGVVRWGWGWGGGVRQRIQQPREAREPALQA